MSLEIRNLRAGEPIPNCLAEFQTLTLEPAYVWLACCGEKVVGALLGARVHGVFMLLRLVAEKDAPTNTSLSLLRYALRAARQGGMKLATCFFDPRRPTELKLARLMSRLDGVQYTEVTPAVWAIGLIPEKFSR